MEIAFFSESYLPIRDGVAIEMGALARQLQRRGHGVTVYTAQPGPGRSSEATEVDGVPVVRVRSLPVPHYSGYRWSFFPFQQLRERRLAEATDVIHLHTPGMMGSAAFLAARHYDKPLLGTFHTNVWEMRGSFPRTFWLRLFFRAARYYSLGLYYRCDLTTAPSEPAREALLRHARKPFRQPVEVVPNGIEVDRFRPGIDSPDWRTRCGLPDVPLVTFLGRLTLDKGIHRFLDALARLPRDPPFAAIVAGAGPEADAVRARVRGEPQLQGRVRYVGPIAEEEKPALLAQSDLFVLPSTADTSSLALLEAMASGAACVASDVGGPSDLIEDRVTGRVVSVLMPGALSTAIEELLERPDERERMRRAGIDYVRREASIDLTARRFVSLYERLARERVPDGARPAP
jgi:glycosyltransferase involved in cell wall biosynthesis